MTVDSNLDGIYRGFNYLATFTFRFFGTILALQKLFGKYYWSSGHTFSQFKLTIDDIAYFDLLSVQCLSNENTTFKFSTDVKIEGQPLSAGKYGFFIAYGPAECILIFSKNSSSWGSYYYNESEDALRVKVKPQALDKTVEWLKYEFSNQTENTATVSWIASSSNPGNYQVYVSTLNIAPADDETDVQTTDTASIDLTGLNNNPVHYIWVRADCGAGDYSTWTGQINVWTSCVPLAGLPYEENFDEVIALLEFYLNIDWVSIPTDIQNEILEYIEDKGWVLKEEEGIIIFKKEL